MIKFYDKTNQVLHSISSMVFTAAQTSVVPTGTAFDYCTFFFGPLSTGCDKSFLARIGAFLSLSGERMAEEVWP